MLGDGWLHCVMCMLGLVEEFCQLFALKCSVKCISLMLVLREKFSFHRYLGDWLHLC